MKESGRESLREIKRAATEHPVHELIAERWSPRAFASRPVEEEKLRILFEAARWGPSTWNEQPWRFLVARREDGEAYERVLATLTEGNQAWAHGAPVLALTVAKRHFTRNGRLNRHYFHDVGLAMGALCAQATALGLHVHQMAGIEPETGRDLHGIPEEYEVVAGVAIGYLGDPDDLSEKHRGSELRPRSRKPLQELVYTGAWETTAPWLNGPGGGEAEEDAGSG